jgi:hypothetical protein
MAMANAINHTFRRGLEDGGWTVIMSLKEAGRTVHRTGCLLVDISEGNSAGDALAGFDMDAMLTCLAAHEMTSLAQAFSFSMHALLVVL